MRAGRAIRHDRQLAEAGAVLCDCGHPVYRHLELTAGNPMYQPLKFYCADCDCTVDTAEGAR